MDNAQDLQPANDYPPVPSEAELRAIMEQSDQDVALGLTVPLADVLAELDSTADRIEARRAKPT